jgi:Tol biopolymer transport system component
MSEKIAPSEKIEGSDEKQLESWKEIAAYLKRDVRTVIRWEKSEGLPVHRHLHQARSSVYAYPSEIDAWAATRQPRREEVARWRRPVPALAFVAVLMLSLLLVADAPFSATAVAAAQQATGQSGMLTRQVWAGDLWGPGGRPAISPDGRYLAYAHHGALNVGNLSTGQSRRLTPVGFSWDMERPSGAVFSPDGRLIAYGCWNCSNSGRAEVRIIGFDGSGPRVLYDDGAIALPFDWSADGRQIVGVKAGRGQAPQMVLVSVADGTTRTLRTLERGRPRTIRLSADGRYVVYDLPAREGSPERDIFLLSTDGSGEIPLVAQAANDHDPVWTPDGSGILFLSSRAGRVGTWFLPVADGKPQGSPELIKNDMGPIEPMGFTQNRSFYYGVQPVTREMFVATLDPVSGAPTAQPTTVTPRFLWANHSAWSPDGRYLAYVSRRPSAQGEVGAVIIVIRSVATGEETEVAPALAGFNLFNLSNGAAWSSDSRSFLVSGSDQTRRAGVFRVDARTGGVTPILYGSVSHVNWYLNGRAVVFIRDGGIAMRDVESGRETEIYRPRAPIVLGSCVEVSRDGRRLAFYIRDPQARTMSLMTMTAPGETPRPLGPSVRFPEIIDDIWALTPDGSHVFYTTYDRDDRESASWVHKAWRVDVEGGTPQPVALAMENFGYVGNVNVHPDGRRIAFTSEYNKSEVWALENFLPALTDAR